MNSFNNHNLEKHSEKLGNCTKTVKKFGAISIVLSIIFLICLYTSYHLLFLIISEFGLFLSLIVGVIGCIRANKLKKNLEILSPQEKKNIKIGKICSIIGIVLAGIFILTSLSFSVPVK